MRSPNLLQRRCAIAAVLAVVCGCKGQGQILDDSGGARPDPGKPGMHDPGMGMPDPGSGGSGPGPVIPGAGGQLGMVMPDPDTSCMGAPSEAPPPTRVRRLTKLELGNTLVDLLGVPATLVADIEVDSRASGYSTGEERSVGIGYAEGLQHVAEAAAAELRKTVAPPAFAAGCYASDSAARTCAATFIGDFGRRAFRRPVEAAERTSLLAVYDAGIALGKAGDAGDRFRSGVEWIGRAVLESPDFIYRTEMGDRAAANGAPTALTPYELAANLAFAVIASPPDATLLDAAAAGQLGTPEQLAAQADRLIAARPDRFAANLRRFVTEWLGIDYDSPAWSKDAVAFPAFTPALKEELRKETGLFLDDWTAGGPGLRRLLTTTDAFVSRTNAPVYGVASTATAPTKIALDGGQRAGLLTQAGFLGSHAHADGGSPVLRGKAVLTRFLCKSPPPVPDNVPPLPAVDKQAVKTTRQRFARHTAVPACAACHSTFEPMGDLFEGYDGLGRFRTTENGEPVDTTGGIVGSDASDAELPSALALGGALAASPEVHACVSRQLFRYLLGRSEQAYDRCALGAATTRLEAQSLDLRALFVALTASSSSTTRTVRSAP
jgi:hypothetical protein